MAVPKETHLERLTAAEKILHEKLKSVVECDGRAGSAFFGLQTVHGMVTREPLHSGTLALVDTDVKKLEWVAHVARRAIVARKAPLDLVVETDRRKPIKTTFGPCTLNYTDNWDTA